METAYMRGARRSTTRGGTIFLCSIQQSRPTRGRPGHTESYPNPSVTNGKPSRRPAVTAHMPHVPPERPNLHSRSATASERLGFTLVTDGLRMLHVPPTGSRYYRGYPPGQKKISQFPEAYRASEVFCGPVGERLHRCRVELSVPRHQPSRGLVQSCEPLLHRCLHLSIESPDLRSEAFVCKGREEVLRRLRMQIVGYLLSADLSACSQRPGSAPIRAMIRDRADCVSQVYSEAIRSLTV